LIYDYDSRCGNCFNEDGAKAGLNRSAAVLMLVGRAFFGESIANTLPPGMTPG
jgi:hypothetical protein